MQRAIVCSSLMVGSLFFAQDFSQLQLEDAIELGLQQNKSLQIQSSKSTLSKLIEKDLKNEKLPEVDFKSSFHVLSNINQYEDGFLHPSTSYKTPRIKYNFTLGAEIPVYLGGKLKLDEEKAAIESEVEALKYMKQEREVRMQIITAYLKVLHLQEQQQLLQSKMKEDSLVISQTEKLQKNGVVTFNEVLRTKLQLSNHKMAFSELQTEIEILEHGVKTLLSIPEETEVHLFTSNLFTDTSSVGLVDQMVQKAYDNSEVLRVSEKKIQSGEIDKKLVKSSAMPRISAGAEYGFSYPNMLFFPPQEHLYRVGAVGVNVTIPISNWYKNKVKNQIAEEKINASTLELKAKQEEIQHDVFVASARLDEANSKIKIAEEAIEQAKENYRIVKLKYTNKLSLITELIDADNALLEAESHLISLQIDKQLKYYQLHYILGNL